MSDYDRWLEPPSTRATERDEKRHAICNDCRLEIDFDGTLYIDDNGAVWSATCPECGYEIEKDVDLVQEADEAYADYYEDEL